jgi:DNA processing protein
VTVCIRPGDDGWPSALNEGAQPPIKRLYVAGKPIDSRAPAIAIVGTRRPTAAGVHAATELATGLALEGYTIVSGLAVGIDAAAHRAALNAGAVTIAVLGCGHDIDYPKRNRALRRQIEAEGTVVSEYPAGNEPKPYTFPLRNRIIVGLSQAVIVVEGTIQSGALVTARLALDANREVFAVPGSIRNVMAQGPNELIRRGEAALVTRLDHVLEGLGGLLSHPRPSLPSGAVDLTEEQRAVLCHLDDVPVSADGVSNGLALASRAVGNALSMLELKGLAQRTYRGYIVTERGASTRAALALQAPQG